MTPARAWLAVSALLYATLLLAGGTPLLPKAFSSLRNVFYLFLVITAAFLAHPGFRALARRAWREPESILDERSERRWAAALLAYFLLLFLEALLLNYWGFNVHAADFSLFDHLIPNTARGRFFQMSDGTSYYSQHAEHMMWLLYPFHRLFDSPYFLLLLHGIVLWAAGIPLWLLMRRLVPVPLWRVMLLFAFFNFNLVARILQYNFHVEVFYVPLLLWLFLELSLRRWRWALVAAFLALLVKEDGAFYLTAVAVALPLLAPSPLWPRLALAGMAVGMFLLNVLWIIPASSPWGGHHIVNSAAGWGRTIPEALANMARRWDEAILRVLTGGWLRNLLGFGFTPLLVPFTLVCLGPFAFIYGTSLDGQIHDLLLYYSSAYVPFAWLGYLLFLREERNALLRRPVPIRVKRWLVLFTFLFLGSSGGGYLVLRKPHPEWTKFTELKRAIAYPASVCAQGILIPHFPYLEKLEAIDEGCIGAEYDYYVANPGLNAYPFSPDQLRAFLDRIEAKPGYERLDFGSFVLFRRKPEPS